MKPCAIGARVEQAKLLAAGHPVGPISSLQNSGKGARRQSIGWSEHVKSIAVEASQAFSAGKPNEAFGIDQNLTDGRMESILGGEYGRGQLLG